MAKQKHVSALAIGAGSALGSPTAVLLYWYLNDYVLNKPMSVEVAIAMGGVVSTFVTTWWVIFTQIFAKFGIVVTPTDSDSNSTPEP